MDSLRIFCDVARLRSFSGAAELHGVTQSAVSQRVRNGECDLGIVSYPERLRDVASIRLRDEDMVLVCAAGHRLAGRARVGPTDLAGQPLVGFDAHLPISREILTYLRSHGVRPEIVHSFDNVDTIKAAVAGSNSVALLPERTVRAEVELGVLSSARLRPTLVRPVGIIHGRGQEFSPLVQSFIAFLLNYESPEPSAPMERATASLTV
jgi:DNA-binding transcriptional LysR family regulator